MVEDAPVSLIGRRLGAYEVLSVLGAGGMGAVYQLYLKGRALVDRRGASVPAGLDLLRKAVTLDAAYALAWAGIADALTVLAYSGAARGSESKSEAMAAAKRSIEIDPTSAVGHIALASATLLYENDRATAKWEFERALELSPG